MRITDPLLNQSANPNRSENIHLPLNESRSTPSTIIHLSAWTSRRPIGWSSDGFVRSKSVVVRTKDASTATSFTAILINSLYLYPLAWHDPHQKKLACIHHVILTTSNVWTVPSSFTFLNHLDTSIQVRDHRDILLQDWRRRPPIRRSKEILNWSTTYRSSCCVASNFPRGCAYVVYNFTKHRSWR